MENHPIPQDITGFQFKLIGSMTVKQFIYIAFSAILAWLIGFMLGLPGIIGWPIAIIIVALGLAFAFVPIDGRPMDTMFLNLIRALFSPTQYIYQKQGGNLAEAVKINQQNVSPNPTQNIPPQAPVSTQDTTFTAMPTTYQPIPQPSPSPTAPSYPQPEENTAPIPETSVPEPTQPTPNTFIEPGAPTIQSNSDTQDLNKLLEETRLQKEQLEKELQELKAMMANSVAQSAPTPAETVPAQQQITQAETKPVAPAPSPTPADALPKEPNLITGVVKDPRGNYLQNILVEVIDLEGNPVRAFKTNNLGKFASATSIGNGTYKIILEDPKEEHRFDEIQIEANGSPIPQLEITSIDKREELRRELFS